MFESALAIELKVMVVLGAIVAGFLVSAAIKKVSRPAAWLVVMFSLVGCLAGNFILASIFGTIHSSMGTALSIYALSLTGFYVWRLIQGQAIARSQSHRSNYAF